METSIGPEPTPAKTSPRQGDRFTRFFVPPLKDRTQRQDGKCRALRRPMPLADGEPLPFTLEAKRRVRCRRQATPRAMPVYWERIQNARLLKRWWHRAHSLLPQIDLWRPFIQSIESKNCNGHRQCRQDSPGHLSYRKKHVRLARGNCIQPDTSFRLFGHSGLYRYLMALTLE